MTAAIELGSVAHKTELPSDLCRCCHAQATCNNINTASVWMDGEALFYCDVIKECFNIEFAGLGDELPLSLCGICYSCMQRVEDVLKFRRQILKCEAKFHQIYLGCMRKEPTSKVAVKDEVLDPEDISEPSEGPENNVIENDTISLCDTSLDGDNDSLDRNHIEEVYFEPAIQVKVLPEKNCKNNKQKSKKNTSVKKLRSSKKRVVNIPLPPQNSDTIKNEGLPDMEDAIKAEPRFVKRNVHFTETGGTLQCLMCSTSTRSSDVMRQHVRSVHWNIPKHTCPVCGKPFPTTSSFIKHKLDEHDIDHRFKCNACDNAFNSQVQLKRHNNSFHMLGVKIKCEQCDYETFTVECMYKHKFKHKTSKDFQCRFCKKAFLRKATMQLHERIHTGDRRKVCAVCGQAFVQKASLNYHMTKYHPEVSY